MMPISSPSPLPRTLFPAGAARAEALATAPSVAIRLIVGQLLLQPFHRRALLWLDLGLQDDGGHALHAIARRLLAPIEHAREVLVRQDGHHASARAQIQTVLALDPDHADAEILRESLALLTSWEADATANALEVLAVHRG